MQRCLNLLKIEINCKYRFTETGKAAQYKAVIREGVSAFAGLLPAALEKHRGSDNANPA